MSTAVLLLNADYSPIKVISWEKAVYLILDHKAHIVADYAGRVIRSAHMEMAWPAVVVLARYVPTRHKVRFNRSNLFARDAYQCQYCNVGRAPIWYADLTFRPLGDVQVGDAIVGWAEPQGLARRKLVRSHVTAVHRRTQPVVQVTMASGKKIICTEDHLWATHRDLGTALPAKVGRGLGFVVDPAEAQERLPANKAWAAGWLAGMYDGEASATFIAQSNRHNPTTWEKLDECLSLLDIPHEMVEDRRSRSGLSMVSGGAYITGGREGLMRFASICRPFRIDPAHVLKGKLTERDTVVDVSWLRQSQEVISLTTEAGNYVAWGYASRNCGVRPRTASKSPKLDELTIDHVVPRAHSKHGMVTLPWNGKSVSVTCWENVVAACFDCNSRKADRTPAQAGLTLRSVPKKPSPWDTVRMSLTRTKVPEEWKLFLPQDSGWKDYWDVELDPD